jgi:hypothetical protein
MGSYGCGVVMTNLFPPEPVLVEGEPSIGEQIGYAYNLNRKAGSPNMYILNKFSLCYEVKETLSVSRKPSRESALAALGATPYVLYWPPLIGIADLYVFQKREKVVELVKAEQTGRIIPCGEKELAANEKVIIQSLEMNILKHVNTDSNGILDLNEALPRTSNRYNLNIFIKLRDSVYYVSTIFMG